MADFTALKTAIQNAIKQNGNEEITGNLLQEVLLAIVTTLGDGSINELITALGSEATIRSQADGTLQQNIDAEAQARGNADTALGGRIDGIVSSIEAINDAIENGYVYAGIATPSSTPTTGKVFYLALTAGTYTNFGNTAVTQGINILKYNGSAWSLDTFIGLDDTPTQGSGNLVKSGGVLDSIIKNGSAFDLSAYNSGDSYADLSAALTALNALPAAFKKGGMSMKFVQSSDNKYVQYRLMSNTFSTTESDWQGVDDEPTAGSENLVKSGEVYSSMVNTLSINSNGFTLPISSYSNFRISENGNWVEMSAVAMGLYHVNRGDIIEIVAQADKECYVGLLSDIDNMDDGNPAHFMDGTSSVIVVPMGTTKSLCALTEGYFFFNRVSFDGQALKLPQSLKKLIPIKRNVLLENLSDKTIIEGEATTSNTSTSRNMIPTTDIFIPANTEFNIQMTGIGVYSSKWGMQINGSSTVYYIESLQAFSFPYNVTSIRILTNKADFISEGVVSARVYIKDLGTIIPEMQRTIQNGLSVLQSISLDTLKEAAGVQTNVFTEDFTINISSSELNKSNCIFSCVAKYVQGSGITDVPTIKIYDSNLGNANCQNYMIGGKDTFECKQWRYPMLIGSNNSITVAFTIPSGVTLTISSFSIVQSNEISRDSMKLFEHSGYWGSEFNTRLAFQQAAVCGYYGAIAVPKFTVDATPRIVCYHDDNTLANNNDLQMVGGEPLTQELGALTMSQLTFAQTQMLEYKSANILGEHSRIPTLDEFFECCAKTGVHPCLSIHPVINQTKLGIIKSLADKYNITDKLTIKMDSDYAAYVYNVFGNDIEAYLPNVSSDDLSSKINALNSVSWDLSKIKVGVEFMNTTYAINSLARETGGISDLVAAGYVWGVYKNTPDINVIKQLNDAGCYEWTIANFFSNGLNW